MPPNRPVAQKTQPSAHPTCELRQSVYFAVGSASSAPASPRRRRSRSPRAARRIGQRNAHRLELVPVVGAKQVLHEAVGGAPALDDLQRRPGPRRSSAAAVACDSPRTEPGGKPDRAVAVHARENPRRQVGGDAEGRQGVGHFGAVEISQIHTPENVSTPGLSLIANWK